MTPATNESRRQSDNSTSLHEAFLARAADASEQRAKARALGAFLTLRLVDQFGKANVPNLGAESLAYQLRAASDFVTQLFPRTVEVNHLAEIVRVAEGVARAESVRVLWPPLLAFGYWLEHQLRLDEALDVLDTALRLNDGRTPEEEVATQLQRARVLRKAGRLAEAGEGYARAGGLATALTDHHSELRSRIGRAIVLQKTGNLPESERVLREVLEDARTLGDRDAEARASQDLAVALALREHHAEAIPFAFRAYELYEHPTHKARALNDTGSLLKELGHYHAAKDALMVVAESCPSTDIVLRAKLELLDVSALIGDRVSFERWRRELRADRALMPPDYLVDFATTVGAGLAGFGRMADAEAALKRAIAVAEEHGLGEGLFRAERVLEEVREHCTRRVDAATLPPTSQPSPEMQRTIDSLRTLCASLETTAAF